MKASVSNLMDTLSFIPSYVSLNCNRDCMIFIGHNFDRFVREEKPATSMRVTF